MGQERREPKAYSNGGEPENYILARRHSGAIANMLGTLWELVPPLASAIERHQHGAGTQVEIRLRPTGDADIFRAEGVSGVYVTRRARDWLVAQAGEWVAFRDVVVA
jgi:hypothetical protein